MKTYLPAVLAVIISPLFTLTTFYLPIITQKLPGCCDQLIILGWPWPFYFSGGFTGETRLDYLNLGLDLIFWFLLTAILLKGIFKLLEASRSNSKIVLVSLGSLIFLLISFLVIVIVLRSSGFLPKGNQKTTQSDLSENYLRAQKYSDFKEGTYIPVEDKLIVVKRGVSEEDKTNNPYFLVLAEKDRESKDPTIFRGVGIGKPDGVYYLGNGKVLVFETKGIFVFDMAYGQETKVLETIANTRSINSIAVDKNSLNFAFQFLNEEKGVYEIVHFNTLGFQPKTLMENDVPPMINGFSNDGRKLLISKLRAQDTSESVLEELELNSGERRVLSDRVTSIAYTGQNREGPENNLLAFSERLPYEENLFYCLAPHVANRYGKLKIYDLSKGKIIKEFESKPLIGSQWVLFNSDPVLIYSGTYCSEDGKFTKIYNPKTQEVKDLHPGQYDFEGSTTNYPFMWEGDVLVYPKQTEQKILVLD